MTKLTNMKTVYTETLMELMEQEPRMVIVDADVAYVIGTYDLYERFHDRMINVGIAEQNMIGVAAGLSAYGYLPVTGTFAAFASRRVCDQIYVAVSFARTNVKMFGADPGILAQINGATHMANEDIGCLRSIPDLMICDPCDAVSLRHMMRAMMKCEDPVYLRIPRIEVPDIYQENDPFDWRKATVLRQGDDVTLYASGIEVKEALQAADLLKQLGISAEVIDVHTIKPLDEDTVIASIRKTGCGVTCDNHNVLGGMGSAVAEAVARKQPAPLEMIGVQDHVGEASPIEYLIKKYKMGAQDIADAAIKVQQRK